MPSVIVPVALVCGLATAADAELYQPGMLQAVGELEQAVEPGDEVQFAAHAKHMTDPVLG